MTRVVHRFLSLLPQILVTAAGLLLLAAAWISPTMVLSERLAATAGIALFGAFIAMLMIESARQVRRRERRNR